MNLFLIVGRLVGQEHDTTMLLPTETEQAAQDEFLRLLNETYGEATPSDGLDLDVSVLVGSYADKGTLTIPEGVSWNLNVVEGI